MGKFQNIFGFLLALFFSCSTQAYECSKIKNEPASIIVTFYPYNYDAGSAYSAINQHANLLAAGAQCLFIGINNERTRNLQPIPCSSVEDGYRVLQDVVDCKKDSIAVIHCHETDSVIPVSSIAKKYNIPVVVTLHSPLYYNNQGMLLNDELPLPVRLAATGIIGVNKQVSQVQMDLNTKDGIFNHITTIPPFFNDTPLRSFTPPQEDRNIYFKNHFNVDLKPCPLLVKVANFYPNIMHKNHALLLCAMYDLIHKRNIPVQVVLAGSGKNREYKRIATDLKIRNFVHFIGKTNKVPSLYNYADINLLSSSKEGLPLVLLEGGLFKKPSIVARTGCGAGDWLIIDHETGFLFENNNAADLADKIEYALSHPEEAKACGQRLYEKVINEFLPNKIVQDLLKFYQLVQPKFILPFQ